ncbi:MAG TPA: PP2C family serine/threonine-protein phosphatase [Pirellulales bacterium]|nr:PP2C family serine/threonine-protein phosphatase [Pirellulales bacterium]
MDQTPVNRENWLEHDALSDIGLRRSNNQDSFAVLLANSPDSWGSRGHLFMVADGMGAHAAGELASKMAVDTVPHTYNKLLEEPPAVAIRKAVEDANGKIHSRGQANLDFRGMGTTASVLLLLPSGAMVAHVGDSRVYRLRGNRIEQLSFDHSLVWEMMASGKLSENEIPSYIPKNIITRSLGPAAQVQVDLEGPFPLAAGDAFLLCSDGLSGQVSDEEIGVILGTFTPREAVRVLVDLANLRGGPDNITVIVARIMSQPPSSAAAPLPVAHAAAGAKRRPTRPLGLVVVGILSLVTLVMAMLEKYTVAMGSGALALVAAVIVMVRWLGAEADTAGEGGGERLGKGPHSSKVCLTNNAFVDKLAKVVDQLREAATEENWSIDWHRFNGFDARALAAAERKNYVDAVHEYGHAISFMMREIRGQRRKRGNGHVGSHEDSPPAPI